MEAKMCLRMMCVYIPPRLLLSICFFVVFFYYLYVFAHDVCVWTPTIVYYLYAYMPKPWTLNSKPHVAHVYVSMRMPMFAYIFLLLYARVYECASPCLCAHLCMYVHAHVCVHASVCAGNSPGEKTSSHKASRASTTCNLSGRSPAALPYRPHRLRFC